MKNLVNVSKQFDEYAKKTIEEVAAQYKKEIADGTFLPLEERLKKQVESGELTQTQADKTLGLINKASQKNRKE